VASGERREQLPNLAKGLISPASLRTVEGTSALEDVLERLTSLRQYQHQGKRVPHKPLLVLLALGQLEATGSSAVSWDLAQDRLADLIAEFGPQTRTGRKQSAAYPFTRLRSDGVWHIDADVPNDSVGSLDASRPTGQLEPELERRLGSAPVRYAAARAIVEAHFPDTVAPDVLLASGLDPELVLHSSPLTPAKLAQRQRSRRWVIEILKAWDECCAFCGYDGRLGSTPVGIEAAHVRWFNLGGPDELDNGFALCSLHHRLFDRGALGLSPDMTVVVSPTFTARTEASRRIYDLHGRPLQPRPGTELPAEQHRAWHEEQVFRSVA
jgi:putative restriction endonuclease